MKFESTIVVNPADVAVTATKRIGKFHEIEFHIRDLRLQIASVFLAIEGDFKIDIRSAGRSEIITKLLATVWQPGADFLGKIKVDQASFSAPRVSLKQSSLFVADFKSPLSCSSGCALDVETLVG